MNMAFADTISFSGLITQSTSDGTGPAVNNLSLNGIADGDAFLVTLNFTGAITSAGTFPLAGATVSFTDAAALASETDFSSASFTVSPNGAFTDLSFLGCLNTGSGCLFGNMLTANFEIAAGMLNSQNVPATTIFGLSPAMDLLEDDGTTDIQGTVTSYSYVGASQTAVPEPSEALPLCLLIAGMACVRKFRVVKLSKGE